MTESGNQLVLYERNFGIQALKWARQKLEKAGERIAARPTLWRWLLAGPGALIAALLFMAAMPVWAPQGAAGVDHLIMPLILAPLFWGIAFGYACIEENLPRCAGIMIGAILLQTVVLTGHFIF